MRVPGLSGDAMQPVHAPKGGETGEDNRVYAGGQFMTFYKPRDLMPQTDVSQYDDLMDWLKSHGVTCRRETLSPALLTAHQRIDRHRALSMPEADFVKPILVSADGYIVDGNHRWFAHYAHQLPVEALRIEADFDDAIGMVFDYLKQIQSNLLTNA